MLFRSRAKLLVQVLVTGVPMALTGVCVVLAVRPSAAAAVLLMVLPQVFVWLSAGFGLMLDLKRPNLTWTNEVTVVKQRLTVLIAMLSGWVYAAVIAVLYLMALYVMSAAWYLLAVTAVTAAALAAVLHWLRTGGVRIFAEL